MKLSVPFAFCLSLCLVGCFSTVGMIPGESKVIQRNISEEYYAIAETYKGQKNYTKAIEYYTLALGNKELHDSAYYQIALCNVYSKNWLPARKSFIKLLKRDPENFSLKMSLAYIEAMCGNFKKAEMMYDVICLDRPNDPKPLVNYVNVLIASEKYELAKEKLNLLEGKFPDDEHVETLKKKVSEFMEDKTDSKADLTKTSEADGNQDKNDGSVSNEELFGLNEEADDN